MTRPCQCSASNEGRERCVLPNPIVTLGFGWIGAPVKKILLLTLICVSARAVDLKPHSLAILGDSGATGVVADPRYFLDVDPQSGFPTIHQEEQSPERYKEVYDSMGISWPLTGNPQRLPVPLGKYVGLALLATLPGVDLVKMSWGYLLGRALGLQPEDIVFAAVDGQKISQLKNQVNALRDHFQGKLPDLTIISFTANDFCNAGVLNPDQQKEVLRKYQTTLESSLVDLASTRTLASGGRVIFMAPLPVVQIISTPALQKKIVSVADEKFSCGEIHDPSSKKMVGDRNLLRSLRQLCPAVLQNAPANSDRAKQVEKLFKRVVQIQKTVMANIAATQPPTPVEYFEDSFQLSLAPEDIANDCFHPSIYGHRKIALSLRRFLQK
jgi:hypothetical protein